MRFNKLVPLIVSILFLIGLTSVLAVGKVPLSHSQNVTLVTTGGDTETLEASMETFNFTIANTNPGSNGNITVVKVISQSNGVVQFSLGNVWGPPGWTSTTTSDTIEWISSGDGIVNGTSESFLFNATAPLVDENTTFNWWRLIMYDNNPIGGNETNEPYHSTVINDSSAPTSTITVIPTGPYINTTEIYYEGYSNDSDTNIYVVLYRVNSSAGYSDWIAATPMDGAFDELNEDWNFTTFPIWVNEGYNTIEVMAIDSAGNNETPPYPSDTIFVDTVHPQQVNFIPNGVLNYSNVYVEVNFTDPLPSSGLNNDSGYLSLGGINVTENISVELTAANNATLNYSDTLADGFYLAHAQIADNATNKGGVVWGFIVDTVKPEVVNVTKDKNQTNSNIQITADALDATSYIADAWVEVSCPGFGFSRSPGAGGGGGGGLSYTFSFNVTNPPLDSSYEKLVLTLNIFNGNDGVCNVSFKAKDAAGWWSDWNNTTFIYDKTPPVITQMLDAAPKYISPEASPGVQDTTLISFIAEDAFSSTIYYKIYIHNSTGDVIAGSSALSTPNNTLGSWVWNGTETLSNKYVQEGIYYVSATIQDEASNFVSTAFSALNVTVDNTLKKPIFSPIGTIDYENPLIGITYDETVTILSAYLDTTDITALLSTSNNKYFYYQTINLVDGAHTINVSAIDLAGNSRTDLSSFTIDTRGPGGSTGGGSGPPYIPSRNRPPVLDPIGNQTTTAGTRFNLVVTATDSDDDVLTFSDNSPLFDINPSTGRISFTPSNAQIGTHTLTITVSDGFLKDSETITFTINEMKPAPGIPVIKEEEEEELPSGPTGFITFSPYLTAIADALLVLLAVALVYSVYKHPKRKAVQGAVSSRVANSRQRYRESRQTRQENRIARQEELARQREMQPPKLSKEEMQMQKMKELVKQKKAEGTIYS